MTNTFTLSKSNSKISKSGNKVSSKLWFLKENQFSLHFRNTIQYTTDAILYLCLLWYIKSMIIYCYTLCYTRNQSTLKAGWLKMSWSMICDGKVCPVYQLHHRKQTMSLLKGFCTIKQIATFFQISCCAFLFFLSRLWATQCCTTE